MLMWTSNFPKTSSDLELNMWHFKQRGFFCHKHPGGWSGYCELAKTESALLLWALILVKKIWESIMEVVPLCPEQLSQITTPKHTRVAWAFQMDQCFKCGRNFGEVTFHFGRQIQQYYWIATRLLFGCWIFSNVKYWRGFTTKKNQPTKKKTQIKYMNKLSFVTVPSTYCDSGKDKGNCNSVLAQLAVHLLLKAQKPTCLDF